MEDANVSQKRRVPPEASAGEATDPEVKRRFEDIARSWHAEMADNGKVVKVVEVRDSTKTP